MKLASILKMADLSGYIVFDTISKPEYVGKNMKKKSVKRESKDSLE